MFETLFNPQRESGEPKVRRNQRSPLRNYAGSAARQACRTTQTSESEEPVRAVRPTLTNEGSYYTDRRDVGSDPHQQRSAVRRQ